MIYTLGLMVSSNMTTIASGQMLVIFLFEAGTTPQSECSTPAFIIYTLAFLDSSTMTTIAPGQIR
jgi:hypothetical protein